MNRRDFLKRLGLVVAAPKIFVLPPSGGWTLGESGLYGGAYYDNLLVDESDWRPYRQPAVIDIDLVNMTRRYIIPRFTDEFFRANPIFKEIPYDEG